MAFTGGPLCVGTALVAMSNCPALDGQLHAAVEVYRSSYDPYLYL